MSTALSLYEQIATDARQPVDRLIRLYEIGLNACKEQNEVKVTKVVLLLNKALNKGVQQTQNSSRPSNLITTKLAAQLKQLYQHIMYCLHQHDYAKVQHILNALITSWKRTKQRNY